MTPQQRPIPAVQALKKTVLAIMNEALHLQGRISSFNEKTPLLGAQPELDSMGVVALLTAFEERLGITIEDDEIDGAIFQTLGSLLDFLTEKRAICC